MAVLVDVGGVDEGAAGVVEGDELVGGLFGVGVQSPGHGAEGEAGDAQAAAAELSVFHGVGAYSLRGRGGFMVWSVGVSVVVRVTRCVLGWRGRGAGKGGPLPGG
ncbi:hypothetical protein GCM10009533_58650 [Saccharopolyspora spinosporotrichia]|uniref:Uncharacterized protein n=1 Tax=Saccharopolyspora erythraea TaxID=1836 RepID=A0ABN1DVH2_SACER